MLICLLFEHFGSYFIEKFNKITPVMSFYYSIGALQPIDTSNSLNPTRAWFFDLWSEDSSCTWLRIVTWNTNQAPSRVSGTLYELSKHQLLFKLLSQLLFSTDIYSFGALKMWSPSCKKMIFFAYHLFYLFNTSLCWTIYIFARWLDRV